MSILLHCGAKAMDRNELANIPTPPPLGARHKPVPFIQDVEMVTEALSQHMNITAEAFGVTRDRKGNAARFFGTLEMESKNGEHSVIVGLRGSHDQSIPRGLAVGSRVFVCDNLAFMGDITYKTKQTLYIDDRLPHLVADAVNQVPRIIMEQEKRFSDYKLADIGEAGGDRALVRMFREQVLNTQTLGRAIQEWYEPSHEEHAEEGFSAWRLMNAVTEAMKPVDPTRANVLPIWERTPMMTPILDELVLDA